MVAPERHRSARIVPRTRPTTRHRLAGLAVASLLLSAPPVSADNSSDQVVAQRGEVTMTAADVRALLASLDPEQQQTMRADPAALASLVRDRMLQSALLAEARAKQWDQRADVAARAEQARNAVIAQTYLTSLAQPDPAYPGEPDIQAAYDANKAKLLRPRQYHLAQLFLAVPAGAAATDDDDARARLAALRAAFAAGKADPALLKKAAKDARTPPSLTDLGWVREDQVIAAIRPTIVGLSEGAVADPVRMEDGWHMVRLIQTRPAAPASLPEVHDALVRALRQARQQQNAQAYLDGMLHRTPIQLNEIALSHVADK